MKLTIPDYICRLIFQSFFCSQNSKYLSYEHLFFKSSGNFNISFYTVFDNTLYSSSYQDFKCWFFKASTAILKKQVRHNLPNTFLNFLRQGVLILHVGYDWIILTIYYFFNIFQLYNQDIQKNG